MFIGHGLLAFAGAAGVASCLGYGRERALAVGVCAGAFALAPDVDIAYAPVGAAAAALNDASVVEGFWGAGNLIHRAVTHSLVVGAVAGVATGCFAAYEQRRRAPDRSTAGTDGTGVGATVAAVLACSLLGGLIAVAGVESGPLGAAVMGLFAAACLTVTIAGVVWGLSVREVGVVALFGLCTHPFGDLFTGAPPAFLYPFDVTVVAERVALSSDPTLHLLGAFAIELATVWLAAVVYASLSGRRLRTAVDWRAALGVGYAGVALAIPAPTLASSYRFVASVLALGAFVGVTPVARTDADRPIGSRWRPWRSVRPEGTSRPSRSGRFERSSQFGQSGRRGRPKSSGSRTRSIVSVPVRTVAACRRTVSRDPFGAALTGLTAVTLALAAYTTTYVYAIGP